MPLYEWHGRDLTGQAQRGVVFADTPDEARERVKARGVHPTLLRPIQPRVRLGLYPRLAGSRPKALATFFHDLHHGVKAGVPIVDLLETIGRSPSPLAPLAQHAAKRVAVGVPLSQALAETGFPFPSFVIPFIQAGEQGGKLDEALGDLARYFEQEQRIRVLSSGFSIFFIGCTTGCLLPLLLFLLFALPSIMQRFSPDPQWALQLHQRMFAHFRYLLWLLLALLGLMGLNSLLSRFPPFGSWWEGVKVRIPLLGLPQRRMAVARFGRVLAMLYAAGLSPSESLQLAGEASGNPAIARAARQQAQRLKQGLSFSTALSAIPYLPPEMLQAVIVGERTGRLDEGLQRIAESLEQEAQTASGLKAVTLPVLFYILVFALVAVAAFTALRAFFGLYEEALKWTEVP